MTSVSATQRANLDLVTRAGVLIQTEFADSDDELFADDFVFHYVNPQLEEFHGDHRGYVGFRAFFERLNQASDTGFRNRPHSLTPYADELVVAFATNTVSFGGAEFEVDAVVVWRLVDGRISEAWDIPAFNTVRPLPARSE